MVEMMDFVFLGFEDKTRRQTRHESARTTKRRSKLGIGIMCIVVGTTVVVAVVVVALLLLLLLLLLMLVRNSGLLETLHNQHVSYT